MKQLMTVSLAFAVILVVLCARPNKKRQEQRPRLPKPGIETVQLGKSVEDRPIQMYVFGTRGPWTFIFAGIHGNELTTEYVALQLVDYLYAHREVYTARRVAVLPAANPEGLIRRTKTNIRGVDCNRNFPAENWKRIPRTASRYGGPAAASEPETRAILEAVKMLEPVRIVSIHSSKKIPPCNNYDGPGKALADLMRQHNGYPAKAELGYPTPGSFGTWAGVERGIPTITLELPGRQTGHKVWIDNRDALLACIKFNPQADAQADPNQRTTTKPQPCEVDPADASAARNE